MPELPFEIPPSLNSYLEQYASAPQKTTRRLETQLKKRGDDAVGHFLLAWFYYNQQMQEKAVHAALKAKIFAPGSPLFEKLHYFLSHPHLFDAWCTHGSSTEQKHLQYGMATPGPALDLDMLIQKLSEVKSTRIRYNPDDTPDENSSKMHDRSDDADNIVSETLARIHEQQGKFDAAIAAYTRLKMIKKERSSFYDERIAELRQKKEKNSG